MSKALKNIFDIINETNYAIDEAMEIAAGSAEIERHNGKPETRQDQALSDIYDLLHKARIKHGEPHNKATNSSLV
jgi:hypothetical protein